jgi:uncharacterized MAPEG superfamily protein
MPRPKGSPNKAGALVRENVIAVFNRLQGTAGMATWAKKNLTEFYRIYARLIPTEMVGEFRSKDATEYTEAELIDILSRRRTAEAQTGEEKLSELH